VLIDSDIQVQQAGSCYFTSGRCCDQSICGSVCLSVRSHISKTTYRKFTRFSVYVTCGRGSTIRYVMYFRFCGRRYLFTWAKYRHRPL